MQNANQAFQIFTCILKWSSSHQQKKNIIKGAKRKNRDKLSVKIKVRLLQIFLTKYIKSEKCIK